MPNPPRSTLTWSAIHQRYELHTYGHMERCFSEEDRLAFCAWLDAQISFAFVGQSGRLSLLKEARTRGSGYWYAYRKQGQRTRKGYLGPSSQVTFVRLEELASSLGGEFSSPSLTPAQQILKHPPSLLSTRLAPPRLPSFLVKRPRLFLDLETVWTHPLTLVSSSAGSGKTTLLSAWADQQKHPVAWLSLDTLDADSTRFWIACIAALRRCHLTLGEEAFSLLHALQPPPLTTILIALLNEMALLDQEVVLILDDFHVVADQAIHDSLAFFLNRLPANIHLVLVTRTDPAFSLSTLRVRGHLLEIRARDLRFTEEEAASFLVQGMNLPLSAEEVALLTSRTEGWIAGLQLAALSLSKQQYPSQVLADFGGSHRYLMDYVQQDILVQLPAQLQDFLLQTSVVTRMNAALCQAVTAGSTQETSQRLLEEVEKANLFVVPLDEHRQWYRYHDLFREALQARLQANQPDLVPLLHVRAARWYEAQGEFSEAIVHALSAADYTYAADLIERCASHLMLSGEAQTVLNWLLSLPDSILCRHIRLTLTAVLRFAQYATITLPAQVESILARLEGFLLAPSSGVPSEIETTLLKRRLELLRGWIELRGILKHGDTERLRKLSQELKALPADEEARWTFISLYPPFWLATMYVGDGAALIPRLREAIGQMKEAGDLLLTIHISAMLAVAATPVAYLHLAQQVCQEALALIAQAGIYTPSEGQLYLCMFCASYAQNRLDAAAQWLQNLQQRAEHWVPMQLLQVLVMGEISAVRLALARGDLAAAEAARSRLEMLTAQGASAHHLPWVSVVRVQLCLAQRDLAAASAWAAQTAFSANHWNPLQRWEVLMLARVLLAKLQYWQTAEMLAQFQQHFDQPTVLDTTIEWMALSVVALYHSGQYKSSLKLADRLLAITVPERYMRLDLDTGEPLMREVLKIWLHAHPVEISELDKAAPSRSAVLHMLASLEQSTQEGRLAAVPAQSTAQHALLEPLSRRERQVLQLLVAGQTYAEMAQTLVVSPNTIKTQVGRIYRKLGVSRRAEAIAVSQRLPLF